MSNELSATEVIWVEPEGCTNPNVPEGTTAIPIPDISLLDGMSDNALRVFPGPLDLDKLKRAISQLCGIVPTVCSRYRYSPDRGFHFALTGSPVPLYVSHSEDEDPILDPPQRQYVVQATSDYDAHVPPLSGPNVRPGVDQPLLMFKYTTFSSGRSSLGMSFGHVVGDAYTQWYLAETLSKLYETGGCQAKEDLSTYPTFELGFGIPGLDRTPEVSSLPGHFQTKTCVRAGPRDEVMMQYVEQGHAIPLRLLVVTFSEGELLALKGKCQALIPDKRISRVDALTGWIGSLPERLGDQVYQEIEYIFNLRAVSKLPNNYIGNAVSSLSIDLRDITSEDQGPSSQSEFVNLVDSFHGASKETKTAAAIARQVRTYIDRLRSDDTLINEWFTISAHFLKLIVEKNHRLSFAFRPEEVYLNSYCSYDYAATFGYPKDQVRYHCEARKHLRGPMLSMGMPSQGGEPRGIEVGMMVPEEAYDRTKELIESDRKGWLEA